MLKKFLIPLIALGTWFLAGQGQPVQAAVNDFTAKAVLPADNAPNVSHFNLVVKPDAARTLSVAVTNEADTAQKFVVEAANAITNSNGIIAYDRGAAKTKPDHVAFCDLFPDARKSIVTIPAHSQQVVNFDIKLPSAPFAGLILGGFTVRSLTAAEEAAKQGQIANLAHYTIGAVLREDTAAVSPQLKLTGAKYRSANGLPMVAIGMTNPTPTIIGTVSLKAKVTNADKQVVAQTNVNQRNFAPSNAFTYALPTKDNKALKPGAII